VSDYEFYFVPSADGMYEFGLDDPVKGNVFRKPSAEWDKIEEALSKVDLRGASYVPVMMLHGIANIKNIETGEHTLVYAIFADLVDEEE
jgi:hypothetical protein